MIRSRFLSILVLCLVLVLCKASILRAQDFSPMAKSLTGIKGLDVFVFKLPDGAVKVGLTKIDLEKIVEEKLSTLNISIEADRKPPFIVVNLRSLNPEDGKKIFYHLDVWIWQEATLVRNPDLKIRPTTTWKLDVLGYVSIGRYKEKIKNRLNDIMNSFLNDYLTANPQ